MKKLALCLFALGCSSQRENKDSSLDSEDTAALGQKDTTDTDLWYDSEGNEYAEQSYPGYQCKSGKWWQWQNDYIEGTPTIKACSVEISEIPDSEYYSYDGQERNNCGLIDMSFVDKEAWVTNFFKIKDFLGDENVKYAMFDTIIFRYAQTIRESIGAPISITGGFYPTGDSKVEDSTYNINHIYGDVLFISSPIASLEEIASQCEENYAVANIRDSDVECIWSEKGRGWYNQDVDLCPAEEN